MSSSGQDYASRRARYFGHPVPDGLKHGTQSYARRIYGCGCAECLPSGKRTWRYRNNETRALTHAERQKKLREAKKGQPVPEGTKHGIYTARVYLCPCDICRAAARKSSRQEKKRSWRDRAHGNWTTQNGVDTICWPPKDAGPDWSCPYPHHKKEVA